ncbi:MAG: tetratricopeptide repeat protein [Acidobacteriota bacterium]
MKGFYRIIPALVLILIIAGGWQSLQRGIARVYVRRAELSRFDNALLERALVHDPSNPDIYQLKGLALYADGAFADASSEFDRAISHRPTDYLLWLYRGRARSTSGDLRGAESDYRVAISLAPHYAETRAELGRLLLRAGRTDEAFSLLAEAASRNESLLPEVLGLARSTFPDDPLAILRAVNPSSDAAKRRSVVYLIEQGMASGPLVSFAAGALDRESVLEAVRNLTQRKQFGLAFDLWKATRPSSLSTASNLLIDGDFENFTGENAGNFGWQVGDDDRGKIEIAVADKAGSSGSRGLEIRFNGDLDANRTIISQLLPVRPKTGYKLTFVSTSEGLVSGGLPIVSIMDASTYEAIADSRALGTPGREWNLTSMEFNTSERTDAINIALRRKGCQSSPCPIFGELRLDDFVLTLR